MTAQRLADVSARRRETGGPEAGPISLYVHIPFCETKCPYCDFNTYAKIEPLMPAYVAALRREIGLWGDALGSPQVRTVFFGGGTPSYLPADDLGALLESIRGDFDVGAEAEVTLEANPGDLTHAKLARYLEVEVNRLSIGIQSFDDGLLELLGRRHTSTQAIEAYEAAGRAGFDNISIDLMYGLPHQGLDQWAETLEGAVNLEPQHVSMYCLTLEGGTPMEKWVATGRLPEPDADLAADMYLKAEQELATRGYRHYEISNWARPGWESLHNLTYWRNQPYLGVGPGAHSYLAGHRFSVLKSPAEYVRRLNGDPVQPSLGSLPPRRGKARMGVKALAHQSGPPLEGRAPWPQVPVVETVEAIDRRLEMAETMMLGLRLDTGVGFPEFARRFGAALDQEYGDVIGELESTGLLERTEVSVRLTDRGRLLGNEVFSRFVGEARTAG